MSLVNKIKHIFKGCTYQFKKKCPIEAYTDLDIFECVHPDCKHETIRKHIYKYNFKTTGDE